MPRVRVTADDGWVALDERVRAEHFDSDHFRRCIAERLAWATADAEMHTEAFATGPAATPSRDRPSPRQVGRGSRRPTRAATPGSAGDHVTSAWHEPRVRGR